MKKIIFFMLVNVLVLTAGLAVGMYAYTAAKRYYAQNVIYIAPLLNEDRLQWSTDDVDALKRRFWDYEFSAESRENSSLESYTQQVITTVIYTDAAYFSINFMVFIEGSIWQEDTDAIVLNEALAWRLFGGGNIVGLTVSIDNKPYKIAGVVRQNPQNLREYMAWMPRGASSLPLQITALYVRANNYNSVDVTVNIREMLLGQLKDPDDYTILNINRYIETIGLRSQVLLLIILIRLIMARKTAFIKRNIDIRLVFNFFMPLFGIMLALYLLTTGVNDILRWFSNQANTNPSVLLSIFNEIELPSNRLLSFGLNRLIWLNRLGGIAWVAGAVSFVNVMVCSAVIREKAIK